MPERLIIVVALLLAATGGWLWWQSRQGRVRTVKAQTGAALTPKDLGVARGERGTVVVFSTPMCAKCPGTKRLISQVLTSYEGITQAEIDAAERLDLAKRYDIMRTPTVMVLDSRGVPVARLDGAPTSGQVATALDSLPADAGYSI